MAESEEPQGESTSGSRLPPTQSSGPNAPSVSSLSTEDKHTLREMMACCFRFTKDNYLNFCEEFMKISKGSKNEPIAKEENFAKLQHFAVLCNTMDFYSHADSTPSKEDTKKSSRP